MRIRRGHQKYLFFYLQVITNVQTRDFSPEAAKERFAELVNQANEVRTAQVSISHKNNIERVADNSRTCKI